MFLSLIHLVYGDPAYVCDPLTTRPLGFPADLACAVGTLLADGGFLVIRTAEAPGSAQIVTDEAEAVTLVRVLLTELRALARRS